MPRLKDYKHQFSHHKDRDKVQRIQQLAKENTALLLKQESLTGQVGKLNDQLALIELNQHRWQRLYEEVTSQRDRALRELAKYDHMETTMEMRIPHEHDTWIAAKAQEEAQAQANEIFRMRSPRFGD